MHCRSGTRITAPTCTSTSSTEACGSSSRNPRGAEIYGEYLARTGDLFRLPKDIAHRTYSLDGKRRITLEILERDPVWSTIGRYESVERADRPELGDFTFALDDESATIAAGDTVVHTPIDFFRRGLRALVAWELHLAHNEFEGGFVVHDLRRHRDVEGPRFRIDVSRRRRACRLQDSARVGRASANIARVTCECHKRGGSPV